MDIKELLNSINTEISSLSYFDTKIYCDEPIIRTAAQMENFLPEQYKKMKRISTDSAAVKKSEQQIFYEQAKFMEDFVDDFTGESEFRCFYPTYSSMNDNQLRAYFSWRSSVRRGVAEETSLSYVYVYLYELLAVIGADGPRQSFKKMYNFWRAYRSIDERLDVYVPLWLKDMVVFYNLDTALLQGIYDDTAELATMSVINNDDDDENYFASLNFLSAYKCENSSYCKQNLSDFTSAVLKVFRGLCDFYERKRSGTFSEKLFGRKVRCPYHIFSSAVFFDNSCHTDYTYILNPIHSYHCANGNWSCERFYGNLKNNKEIGGIFKFIDFLMRQKTGFRHTLKGDDISCTNKKLIERLVDEFFEDKRRLETPAVLVNIDRLSSIRNEAEVIMDKLIVECEEDITVESPAPEDNRLLNGNEKEFLLLLLNRESYTDYLLKNNIMLSVTVDGINEKLFEQFGDTVITYDGESPIIYDDYIDELKGMLI